jgi:hypothetical protein
MAGKIVVVDGTIDQTRSCILNQLKIEKGPSICLEFSFVKETPSKAH